MKPHTDKEKFLELMGSFGLAIKDVENVYDVMSKECGIIEYDEEDGYDVVIGSGDRYPSFYARFRFDAAGKFIEHGCFE